jgi:hypothetical protein
MNDIAVTGNPIIDNITKGLLWLSEQTETVFGPPPTPVPDVELHHAIHDIGGTLLNRHGPMLQESFRRHGVPLSDPRFPGPMATTVRSHLLTMIVEANDAYGLALLGLREHATTAALGPIRNLAETYAYAKWLLEDADEKIRLGRAYRVTMNGVDQILQRERIMLKVAPDSELTLLLAPKLGTAGQRMRNRLTEMAAEDGVTIAPKPTLPVLMEKHLPEWGGYMFYSVLSNSGAHPGAASATAVYGKPGAGVIDYDFKGLHHVRAYWMAVDIQLYLDLGDLVEPVLGWPDWRVLAEQIRAQLEPLWQEAHERYVGRGEHAIANLKSWGDHAPPETVRSAATEQRAEGTHS